MITLEQYVGLHLNSPDWTLERAKNAMKLLAACEKLQKRMEDDDVVFMVNPKTGSQVSGEIYGGFRPQNCTIGAPHSSHKEGLAVDIFDPENKIDKWLLEFPLALNDFGIYIEHPDKTPGWSHWSIRAPGSGKHIFWP